MARLAQTAGLTEFQTEILSTVKTFVDKEIIPYATELEHKDEFPDAAAIKSRATADGDEFVLNGQKMWLTNGARAGVVATLVRDDLGAESVYRNMTTFLVEKEPGFGETRPGLTIPGKIDKMGYKG